MVRMHARKTGRPDPSTCGSLEPFRGQCASGLLCAAMARAVQLRGSLGVLAVVLHAQPTARAIRGEHLWRAVSQAQITNLDRVLDCHRAIVREFVPIIAKDPLKRLSETQRGRHVVAAASMIGQGSREKLGGGPKDHMVADPPRVEQRPCPVLDEASNTRAGSCGLPRAQRNYVDRARVDATSRND
ncbi:MAG: hypothetical protein QOD65_1985 [Gaiellales bacterium]|nr:hypothetical protein [Gaiellales bacterium]